MQYVMHAKVNGITAALKDKAEINIDSRVKLEYHRSIAKCTVCGLADGSKNDW